jgi:heme-degrading monooxygenase HmoA
VFARVLHVTGAAADIEAGVEVYREQVLPYARDATGFRGYLVLLDREEGRALAMSLWASEDAMLAFEERGQRFRGLVAESSGTEIGTIESYEVALLELTAR